MEAVDDDTHERLKTHARFGDSFDDILNRLMDIKLKVRLRNDDNQENGPDDK